MTFGGKAVKQKQTVKTSEIAVFIIIRVVPASKSSVVRKSRLS